MNVQILKDKKGRPTHAVIPFAEYERLRAGSTEDIALIAAGEAARGEETYPADVAGRLAAGEVPLKVIREWRGLSQRELSAKSGVAAQYISQIERGTRDAGRKVAARLAGSLGASVEVLMDL